MTMSKLPMHPVKFVVIYVLVSSLAMALQEFGGSLGSYMDLILVISAAALHLSWTLQSLQFVSSISKPSGTAEVTAVQAAIRSIVFAGVLIVSVAVYDRFLKSHFPPIASQVIGILIIFSAIYFLLRVFWIAASSLCSAEQKKVADAHTIIGTFLLFFYLLVGAPFIFRRLRAIAAEFRGHNT